MDIKKLLKEKRPSLSDSSLNTYASTLNNLYKKVFKDKEIDVNKFDDVETIMEHLKDIPANKRKSILSALVVITNNGKYREMMIGDITAYKADIDKQEKTDDQKDNWVSQDEIKEIYLKLKKVADPLLKKKTHTVNELQQIQKYIIIACLGGIFIPVRRSKDYCDFKLYNIDTKLNYMEGDEFVFNSYKTAKTYSTQKVSIPKELRKIIEKWRNVSDNDWLLFDLNGSKLTNVKLNQRLQSILGKKASVNMLRKSYLTSMYADTMKEQKAMKETMSEMGSSMNQATTYVKLD